MKILPKSKLGKFSFGSIITFFLFFALMQMLVISGQRGGDTFFDNLALSVPALFMGLAGILAFFTGITSIIKEKERSVFVILASLIGLLILVFLLGEFLMPH